MQMHLVRRPQGPVSPVTLPLFATAMRDRAFVARLSNWKGLARLAPSRPRRAACAILAAIVAMSWWAVAGAPSLRSIAPVAAAQEATEYGVKAVCLHRFATPYVKWPDTTFPDKTAPFVVAILGKDPFGKALENLFTDKKVGEHPIKLAHFESIDALDAKCQMLFVPQAQEKHLAKIVEFYKDKPVLIVAESIAAAQTGAHVGFFLDKSRVRFAINPAAAKAAKLEISSELLKLAKVVENKAEVDR